MDKRLHSRRRQTDSIAGVITLHYPSPARASDAAQARRAAKHASSKPAGDDATSKARRPALFQQTLLAFVAMASERSLQAELPIKAEAA